MNRRSLATQLAEVQEREAEPLHTLPPALERRPEQENGGGERKRRRYPSEENRSKATYDLDGELIEALREIAVRERLGRSPSKVAQAFLAFAVEEYEEGRIQLEVEQRGPDWWLEVARE